MSLISRRRLFTLTATAGVVGAVTVTNIAPSSAANNNQTAWNFFRGKGLSGIHTAGLIGNFIVESGSDPINPAAVQYGGGPGRGLAQWEGSRRTQLFNYANSRGLAWSNLGLQLDFIWKELTSTEANALSKLRATTTVSAAAVAVRRYYERPSVHADQARINAANLIHSRYGSGGSNPTPGESAFPLLRNGSRGAAVKTLQYLLRANGRSLTVDGIFGSGTLAQVRAFQKAKGLTVDGVVGPRTWLAVIKTVRNGSSGSAVTALQVELKAAGHSLAADGQFGPATRNAVIAYQKANKLAADGVAGPITWGSLVD